MLNAEADRFELWAINMGLFSLSHGSLDYRVREAESLEHILRKFMTDINEALAEGKTDPITCSVALSNEYYRSN